MYDNRYSRHVDAELTEAYTKALLPSVWYKYRIRTVFGTNRNSGCFFDKEQPDLLQSILHLLTALPCDPSGANLIPLAKIFLAALGPVVSSNVEHLMTMIYT